MTEIHGRHLLCLFLLAFPLSWTENTGNDVRKTFNVTLWSQPTSRRLFARQKISSPQRPKPRLGPPARRCGRLMESCSSRLPCCDPCASCRCRLFRTICHCWRLNALCLKKI
ncbi:agouti-signaling protein 2b [Antennarius striatus]|uniref:agouti-signaling protein 2b n=1 Tax=Antennarius striatus TaxID=241820 RepID=UPI0035B15E7B